MKLAKRKPAPIVKIIFPTDLRMGLHEKQLHASRFGGWTALINNAGSVAHLVRPDCDFFIRLWMKPRVKGMSDNYIRFLLNRKVAGILA